MKKLLLSTLALFSVVGLSACGEKTKKLSADEAKAKLEEIAKANQNVDALKATMTAEENATGTVSMEAPGVAKQSYSPDVKSKISMVEITNGNDSYSKETIKVTLAGVDTLIGSYITPEMKKKLDEMQKETTTETYSVVKDKTNYYYHLVDGELTDYYSFPHFDFGDIEEDIEEVLGEITSSIDEAAKYLNMEAFTLKGNTLTCDKTIIDKDKLNELLAKEGETSANLDNLVVTFNKFELVLNKDNTIKEANIDIKAQLKDSSDYEGSTITTDVTLQFKASIKCEYGTQTITVPESVIKAAENFEPEYLF